MVEENCTVSLGMWLVLIFAVFWPVLGLQQRRGIALIAFARQARGHHSRHSCHKGQTKHGKIQNHVETRGNLLGSRTAAGIVPVDSGVTLESKCPGVPWCRSPAVKQKTGQEHLESSVWHKNRYEWHCETNRQLTLHSPRLHSTLLHFALHTLHFTLSTPLFAFSTPHSSVPTSHSAHYICKIYFKFKTVPSS